MKCTQCKAKVFEFFFTYKKIIKFFKQGSYLTKRERSIVVNNSLGTRQICVPVLALFLSVLSPVNYVTSLGACALVSLA